ncbi:Holliday junction branch migration protein RuvA [Alteromonas oceanisediminis]|uniref:Holliday junction branch migration protein RuvA n=1 Tax=Alteromonas oceanisediminis TaxID=2836180 RepID=UPI001BD91CDA|nr:Holliday junction branch migration protein RuvA [Alteromonas oceanisediminis]MBT0587558.1 Holliday junction branch migration protein RuvA [Alteromonas oceanisediminis]
MIGRLQGILLSKQPPEILLDVNGVGYEVQLPMTSFYALPAVGQQATVFTHFVVREDAQLLYGFIDVNERALFRELIKANGVGPKLGLTILSGMSAAQFMQCVRFEDVSGLVKLPGVGKKTAERLVVELKDRLAKLELTAGAVDDSGIVLSPIEGDARVPLNDAKEEAVSALVALGYKPAQASKAVNGIYQENMTSEALIRESLRSMI